jgi:hypothetical protein
MENRRNFTRVILSFKAQLTLAGTTQETTILDLSLHGALVSYDSKEENLKNTQGSLHLELSDDIFIEMAVKVAHQDANSLGLQCQLTDIDSITHLRRLIELNIGDSELLNRELAHLSEFSD